MSIVERAVELAQVGVNAAEAGHPPAPKTTDVRAPEEPTRTAVSLEAQSSPTLDAVSRTACDLKPIVKLDFAHLRELGRLPSEGSARQTKEEIRRIKWPLLNAIAGRAVGEPVRNNVILVTSALPGEGKTFTALNLALSIVRDRELRVVLVDGDVARPGLTPALGLDGRPGLTDVLENPEGDISSVTYQTDVEGLFVVPAGRWHDQSSELLASSGMPKVLEELVRRLGNSVIILDSPPLLATNEAQVLSRHVGQVLLVVRADDTDQRVVRDAIALIDRSASVSAVLNQVRASVLSRYYGAYHYGYGSGYGAEVPGARRGEPGGGTEE